MKSLHACVLAVMLSALATGETHAGGCASYGGSTYYQSGYEYWPGGFWRGSYYPQGYYPPVYSPPVQVINIAAFIPILVDRPVGYSTYQPVAAAPALAPNAVAPVAQAVQSRPVQRAPDYCKEHTAGLEKRLAFMEQLVLNMTKGGQPDPQVQPPQQVPQQAPLKAPMPPAEEPQAGAPPGLPIAVSKCATCHDKGVSKEKAKGVAYFEGGKMYKLSATDTIRWTKQLLSGKMPPQDAPQLTGDEKPAIMQLILDTK